MMCHCGETLTQGQNCLSCEAEERWLSEVEESPLPDWANDYDKQPMPKLSYSTWGGYYMYGVYDRYFDYERQRVWRGNNEQDDHANG